MAARYLKALMGVVLLALTVAPRTEAAKQQSRAWKDVKSGAKEVVRHSEKVAHKAVETVMHGQPANRMTQGNPAYGNKLLAPKGNCNDGQCHFSTGGCWATTVANAHNSLYRDRPIDPVQVTELVGVGSTGRLNNHLGAIKMGRTDITKAEWGDPRPHREGIALRGAAWP
jgi:hypothetical protein